VSLWTLLVENNFMIGTEVKHLLRILLFVKVYFKEATLRSIAGLGVDE
jgi:hypothetical protein